MREEYGSLLPVSTHSRPKAAGPTGETTEILKNGFNTQPPEGGWIPTIQIEAVKLTFQHTAARRRLANAPTCRSLCTKFQHTAARRRLVKTGGASPRIQKVSTHSRPKAAGAYRVPSIAALRVSTHSRPKAAGSRHEDRGRVLGVSTHSRPKAAGESLEQNRAPNGGFNTQPPEGGWAPSQRYTMGGACFNTQPPEGGWGCVRDGGGQGGGFQHTAARRRLARLIFLASSLLPVSTHSRPKAAGK